MFEQAELESGRDLGRGWRGLSGGGRCCCVRDVGKGRDVRSAVMWSRSVIGHEWPG